MIRSLLRLVGFMVLAGAFAALIVDGTGSIAAGHVTTFSLGETAAWLMPSRMADFSRSVRPGGGFADLVIGPVMRLPTSVVAGVLALAFLSIGRRRRDPGGFPHEP